MTLNQYYEIEAEIVACGGRLFRVCDTTTLSESQAVQDEKEDRVSRINTWERVGWFLGGAALVILSGFMILYGSGQLIPNQAPGGANSYDFLGVGLTPYP